MEIKKSAILFDTISRLSRRGIHAHVRRLLLKSHPAEIAGVIRQMSDADGVALIGEIRLSEVEAKTFNEIGGAFLKTYLTLKPDDKAHLAEVLQKLPEDETAALLTELDEGPKRELMGLMQVGARAEVTELLEYDEGTCGRIMAVNVFSLKQDTTAREAIDTIQQASIPESLFYVYVTDDYENLVGVASLRQILQVDRAKKLSEFMTREVIRITADRPQEEAARLIEEYNFVCLPVVNENGKLLGMVTVDDIIDFIRDEAQDDVLHLAGVEKQAIDDFTFSRAFLSRGFWFLLLTAGGILSSELILRFFPGLPVNLYLLSFAPLALRLGGSIATQTSAFLHQSVINPDMERGRAARALWGQNAVTAVVAIVLALTAYVYAVLRFPGSRTPSLSLAVGLLSVAAFAMTAGLGVPYLAYRLRLDSLKVSSRFFHVTMDVLSLLFFFIFAWCWN